MIRSLPAVLLASTALLGAPAVATAVTLSALAPDHGQEIASAVWIWAGTGLAGVSAMIAFGATVARRSVRRASDETASSVLVSTIEAATPQLV